MGIASSDSYGLVNENEKSCAFRMVRWKVHLAKKIPGQSDLQFYRVEIIHVFRMFRRVWIFVTICNVVDKGRE